MTKNIIFSENKKKDILQEINKSENSFIIIFENEDIDSLIELSERIIKKEFRSIICVYPKISEKIQTKVKIDIVPTINEAKDFIEIENIERKLNFK